MNCQIMFSGENKKNITNLSSAELTQSDKGYSLVRGLTRLNGFMKSMILHTFIMKISCF